MPGTGSKRAEVANPFCRIGPAHAGSNPAAIWWSQALTPEDTRRGGGAPHTGHGASAVGTKDGSICDSVTDIWSSSGS